MKRASAAPSPRVVELTWAQFDLAVAWIAHEALDYGVTGVVGPARGGLPLAVALSHRLRVPLLAEPVSGALWVDDIVDTGLTLRAVRKQCSSLVTASWYVRHNARSRPDIHVHRTQGEEWLVFPWECPEDARKEAADFATRR
jgi:hypoxanthine phosphoribosyltransferase